MDQGLEQRIRQRAYEIWDALGRPDGDSGAHWLAAEREVLAAFIGPVVSAKRGRQVKATPRKSPRKAKLTPARARKMAAA
jgi:hypothetical protein